MSAPGVDIRDVHSLEELNNMIEYSGETMANIEDNVNDYIHKVLAVLEEQLNVIKERLDEAQERLSDAEDALSSCEASQHYDEESGDYTPSCASQERAVGRARKEVEKWQRKYDEAKRIVDECSGEIDNYNSPGGILTPPGGHYLILNMRDNQTPRATEQLREYIERANDVLTHDVGGDAASVTEITNPNVREEDLPRGNNEKLDAFRDAINGVKRDQAVDSSYRNIKDANRAMRCPKCGMPLALCTCNNLHGDVHLYDNE